MSSTSSDKVVPPPYTPGFTLLYKEIILGFLTLSALYFLFLIPGAKLTPADKFCDEGEALCSRPELFAFECINACIFFYQGSVSILSWHIRKTPQTQFPQTPEGRVYGFHEESRKLAALGFVFQFWSVCFTPFIPEFFSPIMMTHHLMAAFVSFLALQFQYYHYYVVFFLALSEVSSMPLVLVSLGKYFPSVFASATPIAQPLFAIGFIYYRVILWLPVSYSLWSDAIYVLSNGIAEKFRPGKSYALYVILVINLALTLLQLFWFTLILNEILKIAGIDIIELNPGFD